MRKTFILSVLLSTVLFCSSQVQVAIFAGPQATSAKYVVDGNKQPNSNKIGYQAGSSLKVPFENSLYFSPSLFYSLKGYKVTLDDRSIHPDPMAIDNNTTMHTVELAALLQYDFGSQPAHFYMKLGPSLDLQLSGREKYNRVDKKVVDQKMVFSYTKYGRYAANLIMHLGYESGNGCLFYLQYGHGIGSINNADNGPAILHRTLGLSFGKFLGKANK